MNQWFHKNRSNSPAKGIKRNRSIDQESGQRAGSDDQGA